MNTQRKDMTFTRADGSTFVKCIQPKDENGNPLPFEIDDAGRVVIERPDGTRRVLGFNPDVGELVAGSPEETALQVNITHKDGKATGMLTGIREPKVMAIPGVDYEPFPAGVGRIEAGQKEFTIRVKVLPNPARVSERVITLELRNHETGRFLEHMDLTIPAYRPH